MATDYGFIFKLAVLVFACLGTSASPSGEVLNVREGKGFEITCWVIFSKDSDSREPVKFLKDGQLVQPSYRVSNRGGVLTVLRARMSDTGAYSCKAGDDVEEVGTIIVQPDTFDPEALGITVAIVAGIIALAMLIVGAIVYKQRCTSG